MNLKTRSNKNVEEDRKQGGVRGISGESARMQVDGRAKLRRVSIKVGIEVNLCP